MYSCDSTVPSTPNDVTTFSWISFTPDVKSTFVHVIWVPTILSAGISIHVFPPFILAIIVLPTGNSSLKVAVIVCAWVFVIKSVSILVSVEISISLIVTSLVSTVIVFANGADSFTPSIAFIDTFVSPEANSWVSVTLYVPSSSTTEVSVCESPFLSV